MMQVQVIRKSASEYVVECASFSNLANITARRKFWSRGDAEREARALAAAYGVTARYRDPVNGISHTL
jgi:hypothetical protein